MDAEGAIQASDRRCWLMNNDKHQFFESYQQQGGFILPDAFSRILYWDRQQMVADIVNSVGLRLKILDLGCGRGELSRFLHTDHTIDGLDISKTALETASQFQAISILGDVESLPLASNCFDLVIFSETIYYLDNPIRALREILRVLKPGGRLVLTCGVLNAPLLWFRLIRSLSFRIHLSAPSGKWFSKRYFSFQLRRLLTRSGFTIIKEVPYLLMIPFLTRPRFIPWMVDLGRYYPFLASYKIFLARAEKEKAW